MEGRTRPWKLNPLLGAKRSGTEGACSSRGCHKGGLLGTDPVWPTRDWAFRATRGEMDSGLTASPMDPRGGGGWLQFRVTISQTSNKEQRPETRKPKFRDLYWSPQALALKERASGCGPPDLGTPFPPPWEGTCSFTGGKIHRHGEGVTGEGTTHRMAHRGWVSHTRLALERAGGRPAAASGRVPGATLHCQPPTMPSSPSSPPSLAPRWPSRGGREALLSQGGST